MEPSEPRQLAASAPVPPTGDADSVDVPNPLSLLDGLREDHTETLTESGELFGTPDWDQWLLDRFVHEHESEEQMCEPSDAESASGALSTGLGAGAIPLDAQDALRQEASEIRSAAEMEVLAGEPYTRGPVLSACFNRRFNRWILKNQSFSGKKGFGPRSSTLMLR